MKDSLEKRIEGFPVRVSKDLDARVHRAIDVAQAERKRNEPGKALPISERILMKIRRSPWATAAVAGATVLVAVTVLHLATPAAFGLEQFLEAYNTIRTLHVKSTPAGQTEPNEFWLESNATGHVARARYYLPVTEDGVKLITWTPEKSEIWFKTKKGFLTFKTSRIEPWMQQILERSQPQLVLQRLLADQKAGKVAVQVSDVQGEPPMTSMVATYKDGKRKEVYTIDPKTELIIRIETYRIAGGNETLQMKTEYTEYNVPIPDKMFSLRADLPSDVRVADQLTQVTGVAQGTMSDADAAKETVRQFFQALVDKDYKTAGSIMSGQLEEYARREYGKVNVTKVLSVGPAQQTPDWNPPHGHKVSCVAEVTWPDGHKTTWNSEVYVRPGDDEARPDRWHITGGVNPQQASLRPLPDGDKSASMTPKQVAAAFFKACAEENWTEFEKFWPMPDDQQRTAQMKKYLGGLEVLSLGEPFQTNTYGGWYVPYEIRFRSAAFFIGVANTNAAKRYVLIGQYDDDMKVREEVKMEPEALASGDPCLSLAPADLARAYFDSISKKDWATMRKLSSEADVLETQRQAEQVAQRGMEWTKVVPTIEVTGAQQVQEGVWFVKCRLPNPVKKWNLAIRNDNAAKRWFFDGGL